MALTVLIITLLFVTQFHSMGKNWAMTHEDQRMTLSMATTLSNSILIYRNRAMYAFLIKNKS